MKFGTVELADAEGAVLAHALTCAGQRFQKGHRLAQSDIAMLQSDGIDSVIAARLQPGDLLEDAAAARVAQSIAVDHLRLSEAATGRVNLYAAVSGMFVADRTVVDRLNRIDPAITLACLADRVAVRAGDMVATIKIIPLAVSGAKVEAAVELLNGAAPFRVTPFRAHSVTLVATQLPSLKPTVMDKTAKLLAQRLQPSGSRIVSEIRTAHTATAVAEAIVSAVAGNEDCQPAMVVVFGASAVIDADDVIPQAIRMAGGEVIHVGMPVDPGNLLVLGRIGETMVIGAPGCARSPRENGFDWVLARLLAGDSVTPETLTGMGVGGLLMEIATRPKPRDIRTDPQKPLAVGLVLLAAGKASRMGTDGPHKLLAEFSGIPLVRRSAETACASKADAVVVVTGHRAGEITDRLTGLPVHLTENADFASGMASSLIAGFSAPQLQDADGILVMLADMPGITVADLDALLAAFQSSGGKAVVRAVANGKRGNPVILPRGAFDAVLRLQGDVGARHIIETSGLAVIDVDIGPAAHLDVDTPDAVLAAGGILKA
jgi:molybdenum cofactor cytidylyltransferase